MSQEVKQRVQDSIRDFRMPRYNEIPDVGLFLEQTTKFISEALKPLENIQLTSSMISNYVKRGLVAKPVRKQYDREQIAYLIFIAVTKNILSLEDIQLLINLQKKTYTPAVAYQYFCMEVKNILFFIFGLKDAIEEGRMTKEQVEEMYKDE